VSGHIASLNLAGVRAAWAALLLALSVGLFFGFCLLALIEGSEGQETLVAAAERGELLVVRRLLRDGVQVDTRDGRGRTALLAATQRNHAELARLLINEGADVNARDFAMDTPFLVAGAEGRSEILKSMLIADPDLRSVNRFGSTALIPACRRGHIESVRLLLTTAIDRNHVNSLGLTALMEAVLLGDGGSTHAKIVRLLVAAGADIDVPDRDSITALAHARQRGYDDIVRILEAAAK
jgi:uncharacterized protein